MTSAVNMLFTVGVLVLPATTGAPFNNVSYYTTTCDSPECALTAKQLLTWLDPEVDPCEDFYRFTCGKQLDSGEMATDRDDIVKIELKRILEEPPLSTDLKCHQQLRRFYSLCLDEETINGQGIAPAVELLRRAGQWPLLEESWSEDSWRWESAEAILQRWGLGGALLNVYVSDDLVGHDKFVLFIDEPRSQDDMTEMVSYMFSKSNKKHLNKTREEIIDVVLSIAKQTNVSRNTIKESITEAYLFKEMLKNTMHGCEYGDNRSNDSISAIDYTNKSDGEDDLTTDSDDNDDDVWDDYSFTVVRLQKNFPWADWRTMLKSIVSPAVTLQDDDVIHVISSDYLQRLGILLNTVPKESVANYMMWNAAVKMAAYLSADVSELTGVQSGKDRWQHCVEQATKGGLSLALASLVAKQNKDNLMIKRALGLAKDIQYQLVGDLAVVSWVDETTRKRAQTKISETEFHIGYPPELLEDTKLIIHYKKFKINTTTYFEATLESMEWERNMLWAKIRLSAKKYDWRYDTDSLFMRNAYNMMLSNRIEVTGPELIFQNIFNSKIPSYIAYGDLGTTIGHELIHSLDNNGIYYNEKGDFENWFEGQNFENFTKRAQCIIDQYSSFNETTLTQLKINGEATQGESISDNSGLKVAYHAHRKAANQLGLDTGLPDLQHYTPDQLFFITAANYFCEITDKERITEVIKRDPHPPNEFRVRGMMMNSRDFSLGFNCDANDYMNSPGKCEVW